MARPTWAGLKAEAILELRNRSDIATRIEVWLREAYLEIAYGYRFYELEKSVNFTLSVGASEITFVTIGATDIKHTLSLKDETNGRKLDPAPFRFLDRRIIGSGIPTHYCRFGVAYLFDARVVSAGIEYKLRYRKQITEPIFSGDNFPETPHEWDEVIRLFAVSRGFNALFEPELGASKRAIALDLTSRLPTDEFVEAEDANFGIEVRQ